MVCTAHSQPNLYVRAKRQTANQDQLRLFPSCSPAVGEDSPGEPPMESYDLATAYPKQQQQHNLMFSHHRNVRSFPSRRAAAAAGSPGILFCCWSLVAGQCWRAISIVSRLRSLAFQLAMATSLDETYPLRGILQTVRWGVHTTGSYAQTVRWQYTVLRTAVRLVGTFHRFLYRYQR